MKRNKKNSDFFKINLYLIIRYNKLKKKIEKNRKKSKIKDFK